jgi:hypothetical protein
MNSVFKIIAPQKSVIEVPILFIILVADDDHVKLPIVGEEIAVRCEGLRATLKTGVASITTPIFFLFYELLNKT